MTLDDMLAELADDFGKLLGKFEPSRDGLILDSANAAEFHRLCLETKALLTDALGPNEYSTEVGATTMYSSLSLFSGPSYETVERTQATVRAAKNFLRRRSQLAPSKSAGAAKRDPYASIGRLDELKAIKPADWDLTRLVRLCEELNAAHEAGSLMSTAMLVRSIMDHVPPIFGGADFSAVANNYVGRSVKASLQHLEKSMRNVADAHLHSQIRKREVLPTAPQVDFKADLDVLLGEVVRTLKP